MHTLPESARQPIAAIERLRQDRLDQLHAPQVVRPTLPAVPHFHAEHVELSRVVFGARGVKVSVQTATTTTVPAETTSAHVDAIVATATLSNDGKWWNMEVPGLGHASLRADKISDDANEDELHGELFYAVQKLLNEWGVAVIDSFSCNLTERVFIVDPLASQL